MKSLKVILDLRIEGYNNQYLIYKFINELSQNFFNKKDIKPYIDEIQPKLEIYQEKIEELEYEKRQLDNNSNKFKLYEIEIEELKEKWEKLDIFRDNLIDIYQRK